MIFDPFELALFGKLTLIAMGSAAVASFTAETVGVEGTSGTVYQTPDLADEAGPVPAVAVATAVNQ